MTTAARLHGYDVLLVPSDEGPEGVRRVAASGLEDGVILMDVVLDDRRLPALRAEGTQAVLIGLPDDPLGLSCVDHDFTSAGALCADHLADLGGFRERAESRGLRFLHRPCDGTYEGTTGTLARVLADRPDTTGFVVQNEGAIGPLLGLLRISGRAVPEDASMVALCPEQLAGQRAPLLTAVSGPAQELGRVAVEQLMRRLDAATRGEPPQDERVLLPPLLTVRQSSALAKSIHREGSS